MGRRKPSPKVRPEIFAVLRVSPKLEPCTGFRHARLPRFVAHVNEGKCGQCIAFVRQSEKELKMMRFLKAGRN